MDSTGDFKNGHILYAYNDYGKLYNSRSNDSAQLNSIKYQDIVLEESNNKSEDSEVLITQQTEKETEINNIKEQTTKMKLTPSSLNNDSVVHASTETKLKGQIVLGSFKNENNALNFKKALIVEGNQNVKISFKNSMYRVAVFEENDKVKILSRLELLRKKYPDAWLVFQKE